MTCARQPNLGPQDLPRLGGVSIGVLYDMPLLFHYMMPDVDIWVRFGDCRSGVVETFGLPSRPRHQRQQMRIANSHNQICNDPSGHRQYTTVSIVDMTPSACNS